MLLGLNHRCAKFHACRYYESGDITFFFSSDQVIKGTSGLVSESPSTDVTTLPRLMVMSLKEVDI